LRAEKAIMKLKKQETLNVLKECVTLKNMNPQEEEDSATELRYLKEEQ